MEHMIQILVVDDEEDLLQLLVQRLKRKGYKVDGALSGEKSLKMMKEKAYDVGIFDIKMPGMDGIELLKVAKKLVPDIEVIMLTGHGTVETAIEAMKSGAYDYLTKPYNLSELDVIIQKAIEKKQLFEENQRLKEVLQSEGSQFEIVGEHPKLKMLLEMTKRVSKSHVPVLIEGESGTGKELIARALHAWSDRANQPFIAINSGALMENLLESELFGHAKGAFTGAVTEKKGLVEMAHKGTLFLDEIGEMPLSLQVKLLRFLESGEFRRVGDNQLRKVDVRLVAATNRNLEKEIEMGNFREDLYFRLNVMKLVVPPLRERKSDIPLLAQYFLTKYQSLYGEKQLSNEALQALSHYHFPGNIRELSHLIERGVLLSMGKMIQSSDIFPHSLNSVEEKKERKEEVATHTMISLEELERQHIERVLKECDWNKTKAAQILGISLRNLYRKIESYQLEPK
ncbi:sigma-54-dependent transcriptional regulator [Tepidibacillus fermentans]|uniref:Two-component system NtrC family response regulator/two-component system response regulator AtoC n=1 Tax=Tepidibacillus fermentans TaxID=1281767 RepID=A0A4R3KGX8_9BACI|nr:sigma-54 dependent transcriptional regulator [Tepidibacillus fermentans]TCS82445.1 two-component system NtrC family response regulator/two-component system response regulator AtoC [Tepidibacillus fermentans]